MKIVKKTRCLVEQLEVVTNQIWQCRTGSGGISESDLFYFLDSELDLKVDKFISASLCALSTKPTRKRQPTRGVIGMILARSPVPNNPLPQLLQIPFTYTSDVQARVRHFCETRRFCDF